jgi:Lon-like ATP-dependent protease
MSEQERKEKYFGKGKSKIKWANIPEVEWDWENFHSTEGFPLSTKLLDWVIGQDQAMKECYLCLDEWVHKLKNLDKDNWWKDWENPENAKPTIKKKLSPGPYLFLLGDPGTGKSLIGRALAEKLTDLYKEHNVKMYDVLSWKNLIIPSEPRISILPSPKGKEIISKERKKVERKAWKKGFWTNLIKWLIVSLGTAFLFIASYVIFYPWLVNNPECVYTLLQFGFPVANIFQTFLSWIIYCFESNPILIPLISGGGILLFSGMFMGYLLKMLGGMGGGSKGIGNAENTDAPKMLIDNSQQIAQFIDATGHGSSQLFGSIAWDPYQTGGLGTPEHQRVSAGDVHRANLGILYIDELKNLLPAEAITLLTVLEDGQLPIALRSQFHGGDTSAMAVATEPLPCVTFLVGAGNFDSIHEIHPALMDRIYGYGKVVRMNNDFPNTEESRRRYVQFIAQEINRFNLMPFTRDACIEVVEEARRKSDKRETLTAKFRPLISILKTASVLAMNAGETEVSEKRVKEAITDHCKTIQKQILENYIKEENKFLEINPSGKKPGIIYGLAVCSDPCSGESVGSVLRIKAQMIKAKKDCGYFRVTGVPKDALYMPGSISKVRSVILKKYGVDVAKDYCTHIDFSQSYAVDGPSAGVTMTLALCSLLEKKPIRQDVAVTGEINISSDDEIEITAVGGLYEKIKAAESWNFKEVVIPDKNYQHSIEPTDFKVVVRPGKTLDDYLKVLLS